MCINIKAGTKPSNVRRFEGKKLSFEASLCTYRYEGFTSNIVFFIAAADTSCVIDVYVPHSLLNQNNLAFCHSRSFIMPYKVIGNAWKTSF